MKNFSFTNCISKLFSYNSPTQSEFVLPNSPNNVTPPKYKLFVSSNLTKNLDILKVKYSTLINSDIIIRKFIININNKNLKAFLIFIDGMSDTQSINSEILQPLFLKNMINMKNTNHSSSSNKKINLKKYIYQKLIPQNNINLETDFNVISEKINNGHVILFIDTCNQAFCIESKKINGRQNSEPQNETIIRGSREAFVENIRINTSLLRKTINNENFVIENISIGEITKTSVSICYISNITNNDLVSEVKNRLKKIKIDSLISSGQLEQLIKTKKSLYPELIATERTDRTCFYILTGRVAILINGSPYALIVPAIFSDFLTTPEDTNLNYAFSNFLRLIRLIALFFSVFLPGLYIAIIMFHQELIPSELLFAIANAREAIPFPILFEIILMELSFELIREAGIRVPSPFGQTIGIIGALVLGEAAVSAKIVSPILIIIVAFTGLCNFAIPDFSFSFSLRIMRFMYIFLGYISGLLGVAVGFFAHFAILSQINSFGIPYFSPYIPISNFSRNQTYYIKPIWKRKYRNKFLNTKRPIRETNSNNKNSKS